MLILILIALLYVAWMDLRSRTIPNWLTFGLILTGLTYKILTPTKWGIVLLMIFLSIFLYMVRFWAEGDTKLFIGLSLWLTNYELAKVMFIYCVIILIMGVVWMVKHKQTTVKLSYPAGVIFLLSYLGMFFIRL